MQRVEFPASLANHYPLLAEGSCDAKWYHLTHTEKDQRRKVCIWYWRQVLTRINELRAVVKHAAPFKDCMKVCKLWKFSNAHFLDYL